MFMANCTVSILRGVGRNQWGDEVDLDTPVHTDIPASIREIDALVTTSAEGRGQTVRMLIGRLPAGTDVRDDDRLRVQETGKIYIIDRILHPESPIMAGTGIRLDLRRVS